jgi:hypothetical protein
MPVQDLRHCVDEGKRVVSTLNTKEDLCDAATTPPVRSCGDNSSVVDQNGLCLGFGSYPMMSSQMLILARVCWRWYGKQLYMDS